MKESLLTRSWSDEKSIGLVDKTFYNDETYPKTDLTDPHI